MRQAFRWILATGGTAACLWAGVTYWPSRAACPAPTPVLLDLALIAVGGLGSLPFISRDSSSRWKLVPFGIAGALGAAAIAGAWSFAPWALLGAPAYGAVALLGLDKPTFRRLLAGAGLLLAGGLLNFLLLFPVAKHSGVEVVELPPGSLAARAFDRVDYADAYRVRLPPGRVYDLDTITKRVLVSLIPCWQSQNRHDWVRARVEELTLQPGTLAFGKVYARAENEILMGEDEPHLNFRLSVMVSEEGGTQWLTVSTVVQYNNWAGRAYFVPVRFGHQVIVPQVMRTALHTLR